MAGTFERLSIRTRVVLLMLAILLPVAATLAWFLAADVRQARTAARERVRTLAVGTASELQHRLDDAENLMAQLAQRPAVKAMGRLACAQLDAELMLPAAFSRLSLRDAKGQDLCAVAPAAPPAAPARAAPPVAPAAGSRLEVGDVGTRAGSGEHIATWSYPVHDGAGTPAGRLVLEIDLLELNRQLFAGMPGSAVVTVVDARRGVLLRSTDPEQFIGQVPRPGEADPAHGAKEGYMEVNGRDGVPRLFAFMTLPGAGWRVAGSMPVADVFAEYDEAVRRTVAIGFGLTLVALALAWRLSAAIVKPVAELREVAERAAAGDDAARGPVDGPPEVRALAQAFNRLLEARRLSESRLRGIFDSAVDAIITADEDQRIVEANPAAARLFRCSLDELIGAPLERLIPARLREAHAQELRRFGDGAVSARRMAGQREVLALRADGVEFPIEASISHLQVGGRRLFTVIHRDVTERRRLDEALRGSEARLRQLLAQLPEAVFVNSGNRISFVNQAACRLFGADEKHLLGTSPLALIHPDSRALVERRITAMAGGEPVAELADEKILRADGSSRDVQTLATLLDHEGESSILVVMRDVTDLKQAQADLEISHAELTRLVSALDHIQEDERKRIARELHDDLQQTLAAVRMDLGTAAAQLDAEHAPVRALLARIDELAVGAIRSTRRIINDLRPQMLEDLGLVDALEALAMRFSQRHGVACELDTAGMAPDDAGIDAAVSTCLYRVAQEALNNAAKHAGAGRVRMKLQRIGAGRLRLVVDDDGIGISEDDLRKPQSFGLLGMRERVRAAGGTLRIDGEPHGGTTLQVEVALAVAAAPA
jgi:PAS domain S-box-containing protein